MALRRLTAMGAGRGWAGWGDGRDLPLLSSFIVPAAALHVDLSLISERGGLCVKGETSQRVQSRN